MHMPSHLDTAGADAFYKRPLGEEIQDNDHQRSGDQDAGYGDKKGSFSPPWGTPTIRRLLKNSCASMQEKYTG